MLLLLHSHPIQTKMCWKVLADIFITPPPPLPLQLVPHFSLGKNVTDLIILTFSRQLSERETSLE